jgi:hypothetical protein
MYDDNQATNYFAEQAQNTFTFYVHMTAYE